MSAFINSVSKLVGVMSVQEKAFAQRSFTRGFSAQQTAALIKEVRS